MAAKQSITERFANVTSAETAKSAVMSEAASFKRHHKAGESKIVDAAYATWYAVKFDLILEGRKTKDSPKVEWTHEQYANLYDGGDGTVKSRIGAWIVLGYALVVLELSPDSGLFKQLRKGVDFTAVKEATRAAKPTAESLAELQTLVDIWCLPDNQGKRTKDDRIAQGSGETPAASNGSNGDADKAEPEPIQVTAENAGEVMTKVIRDLFTVAEFLDDKQWNAAKRGIAALSKQENERRKTLVAVAS